MGLSKHIKSKVNLVGSLLLLAGCGNSWMVTSERAKTPSALIAEARHADDKGDYDKAVALYKEVLAKDPNNDDVRIRLAYSLNAKAGLGLLDIVARMAENTAAATPTPATTSSTSSAGGLDSITSIVGLSATEKSEMTTLLSANSDKPMSYVREVSNKMALLHESWTTICRLLPSSILENVIGTDPVLISALNSSQCKGGIASSKPSAMFAAVMQLVTEAVILYQTVIDANGDGQIDLLVRATAVNNDISAIQAKVKTATGTEVTTLLTQLNTNLAELKKIGDSFKGEMISITLADFSLMAKLIENLSGLPDELKTNIQGTVSQFSDAKSKMNTFSSTSSSSSSGSSSGTNDAAKTSAAAAETMNEITAKVKDLPPAEKAAAQAQITEACTNFDAVKTIYNLPSDTQKPQDCQSSSLNLTASEGPATNVQTSYETFAVTEPTSFLRSMTNREMAESIGNLVRFAWEQNK